MKTWDERERLLGHLDRLRREARSFSGMARKLSRALAAFDHAMFYAGSNQKRDAIRRQMTELADGIEKAFRASDERKKPDLQGQVSVD